MGKCAKYDDVLYERKRRIVLFLKHVANIQVNTKVTYTFRERGAREAGSSREKRFVRYLYLNK